MVLKPLSTCSLQASRGDQSGFNTRKKNKLFNLVHKLFIYNGGSHCFFSASHKTVQVICFLRFILSLVHLTISEKVSETDGQETQRKSFSFFFFAFPLLTNAE